MFGSDWRTRDQIIVGAYCLFCAVILGIAIYLTGLSEGTHRAEAENYAAQYPADTDKRVEHCFAGAEASVRPCIEEAIATSHEAQRNERDLNAQRDMAKWAKWLLIVTIVTLFISVAGLLALLRTIRQGHEANEIAKDAIAQGNRAWLRLKIDREASYTVHSDFYSIQLKGSVENKGNGVANDIKLFCKAIIIPTDAPSWEREAISALEERIKPTRCSMQGFASTMFPGDTQPLAGGCWTLGQELEIGKTHHVMVISWLEYRLSFDGAHEQRRVTEALCTLIGVTGNNVFYGNEIAIADQESLHRVFLVQTEDDHTFSRPPRIT